MRLILLTIFFLSLILGIRYAFYLNSLKSYKVGDTFETETTLLSDTRQNDWSQSFKIGQVTVQVPREPELHYGDAVHVRGKIEESTFQTTMGQNVRLFVVKNPEISLAQTRNPLIITAAWVRSRIQATFDSYLPNQESALLFGIVFGGATGFDRQNYEAFRNAGVLHVIAASGMNVTMVAGFLFAVFGRFFKRQHAIILAILGIFYYVLISGFSASIVRAALMGSVAFTAGILGRKSIAVLSLVLTVFSMLFVTPSLILDVGFLLSITATLGILFIKPIFDNLGVIKKTKTISNDITTSLSAQAGSIPILVGSFGTYSIVSILVNALVLWTIPILMILGGVAALVCLLVPVAAIPLLYLAYPFLLYFEYIVIWFGKIPQLQVTNVPVVFWIGYYLMLLAIVLMQSKKSKLKSQNLK